MLYVVGTPIGNLGDISERALSVLSSVDFIAAEDTRNTLKLLNRFDIKKPLISYYEHNKEKRGEEIISRLLNGEDCALVSDAGMPIVSDPGEDLVKLCIERDIPFTVIPGPCALITALCFSGLPSRRFCFEGFLPVNKSERKARLDLLKKEERTMLFYEAPHKLRRTLCDLYDAFGDRNIAIARELTKIHEEVLRIKLSETAELYNEDNMPKGEFVLVVEGAAPCEKEEIGDSDIIEYFNKLIAEGKSPSYAAKETAKALGIPKNKVYGLCVG